MNMCKKSVLKLEITQEPNGAIPVISQDKTFGPEEGALSLGPSRYRQEHGQDQPPGSQPHMDTSRPHKMEVSCLVT